MTTVATLSAAVALPIAFVALAAFVIGCGLLFKSLLTP